MSDPVRPNPREDAARYRARLERAMDIEYAFFARKHPWPASLILEIGDCLVALDRTTLKRVGYRVVKLSSDRPQYTSIFR